MVYIRGRGCNCQGSSVNSRRYLSSRCPQVVGHSNPSTLKSSVVQKERWRGRRVGGVDPGIDWVSI